MQTREKLTGPGRMDGVVVGTEGVVCDWVVKGGRPCWLMTGPGSFTQYLLNSATTLTLGWDKVNRLWYLNTIVSICTGRCKLKDDGRSSLALEINWGHMSNLSGSSQRCFVLYKLKLIATYKVNSQKLNIIRSVCRSIPGGHHLRLLRVTAVAHCRVLDKDQVFWFVCLFFPINYPFIIIFFFV